MSKQTTKAKSVILTDENSVHFDILSIINKPDYDESKQCVVRSNSEFGQTIIQLEKSTSDVE